MKEQKKPAPLTPIDSTGQRMRAVRPGPLANLGRTALPAGPHHEDRGDVPPGYHRLSEIRGRFPPDTADLVIKKVLRMAPAQKVNLRTMQAVGSAKPDENTLLDPLTWSSVLLGAANVNNQLMVVDELESEFMHASLAAAKERKRLKEVVKRLREIPKEAVKAKVGRDRISQAQLASEEKELWKEYEELRPEFLQHATAAQGFKDEAKRVLSTIGVRMR